MPRGQKDSERRLSEDIDRLLAGEEVRADPTADAEEKSTLGFARRMAASTPEPGAAFAALVQVAPSRGRTAISYLTLFGAFASSVFWVVAPTTHSTSMPPASISTACRPGCSAGW